MLVATLTKRTAVGLTDYLAEKKVRVSYQHSEIHSIELIEIIQVLCGWANTRFGGRAWTYRR